MLLHYVVALCCCTMLSRYLFVYFLLTHELNQMAPVSNSTHLIDSRRWRLLSLIHSHAIGIWNLKIYKKGKNT